MINFLMHLSLQRYFKNINLKLNFSILKKLRLCWEFITLFSLVLNAFYTPVFISFNTMSKLNKFFLIKII